MTDKPRQARLSELTDLARQKVREASPDLTLSQLDAATALLTEVYAVGLRHRIRPQDWAAVASLPREFVDAVAQRDHLAVLRRQPPAPFSPERIVNRETGVER
jgi:hypothetical protein